MKQIALSIRSASMMEEGLRGIQEELKKRKYQSVLIHVFSGIEEEEVIHAVTGRISQFLPGIPIVGTLSAGEIVGKHIPEKGIAASVLFFERSDVRVIRKDGVKGREREVGRSISEAANSVPDLKAVELLLPGTEFNTRRVLEELSAVQKGVAVYGGYSGGHQLEQSEHFIFIENGEESFIDRDAIYAICYSGEELHVDVDKSAGWQRLGMPFKVTEADENRLVGIDGVPAVEIYEKYLQIDRHNGFAEETFEFPLMASMDGEELLRHTITVEEDGTLDLAGFVTNGMDIYLSYGNPEDIISRVNRRLERLAVFHPEAILLFSCSVRKSFWESFAEIELEPFQEIASTSGFYTWGEVKRNPQTNKLYEYNITMLSVAMREGDAEPLEDRFVVDDSGLKGQASLLKRLSKLVAATTGELQKANLELRLLNEKLKVMADYDALTGMYNRRKIEERMSYLMKISGKEKLPVGLIMLDIDHFKEVNDTFGHGIGDEVLSILGKLCIREVKSVGGNLGRWGGEEFFIVIPGYDTDQTFAFAEMLRKKVEKTAFPCVDVLTISLGVSSSVGGDNRRELYVRVDEALYAAKQAGRNRTVIAGRQT